MGRQAAPNQSPAPSRLQQFAGGFQAMRNAGTKPMQPVQASPAPIQQPQIPQMPQFPGIAPTYPQKQQFDPFKGKNIFSEGL